LTRGAVQAAPLILHNKENDIMTRTLDRSRTFGEVIGGGEARYEQDNLLFNVEGNLIGEEPAQQKAQTPKPAPKKAEVTESEIDKQLAAQDIM
jgi:hypothetical protein